MSKKLLLTLFIMSFVTLGNSQISLIKKNISELFFKIPVSPSKYDVRSLIKSDINFYDIGGTDMGKYASSESYETISANFKENLKLSYLGRDEKNIIFWFDYGTDISDSRKILTEYFPDEFPECKKQLEEIYNIFNKYSYKAEPQECFNGDKEKTGIGWAFYSSQKSLTAEDPYLTVIYRYFKISLSWLNPSAIKEEGYIFEIIFKDKNIY